MLAIFKREFKNFFHNVIGWVFIAAIVFVASLYFKFYNLQNGVSNILYVLINLLLIMVFALPVLAMRVLPEERKQKTDQLILTSPVSIGKIVVGKYLAMFSVLLLSTAVVSSYLLIINKSVAVDWKLNLVGIAGFILYCGTCLAICLFISSFFESQVVSTIVCIVVLFAIRMISGIVMLMGTSENKLIVLFKKILNAIDLSTRYDTLLNGVFDLKVIVFYITLIILFLFLTAQSIQKRRYTVSVKSASLGAFSVFMIVIVFAVVICINLVMSKLPAKYTEIDCTNNNLFQLSDTTKDILSNLDQPITIYVYANEQDMNAVIDKVLSKYSALSKNITVEYKDPDKAPMFYKNFTDENVYYNSLFIENTSTDKKKYISTSDLIVEHYTYDESGNVVTEVLYDIEGQVTSSIAYVTSDVSDAHAYYILGHDEYEVESRFTEQITKQNIQYTELNLMGKDIPQDCSMLVINSPLTDFNEEDANKVIEYAKNGGKLFIILPIVDDIETTMPNFQKILDIYGVHGINGVISDTQNFYQQSVVPILIPVNSELTKGVADSNKYIVAPIVRGLTITEDDSRQYTNLLMSSDTSVSKMDLNTATSAGYEEGDLEGPFITGVFCKATFGTTYSEGFIFGSTNMFADMADQVSSGANSTIFLNCMNKSRSDDAITINIASKKANQEEVYTVKESTSIILFYTLWLVLPLAFIIIGIVIWRMRSKR